MLKVGDSGGGRTMGSQIEMERWVPLIGARDLCEGLHYAKTPSAKEENKSEIMK